MEASFQHCYDASKELAGILTTRIHYLDKYSKGAKHQKSYLGTTQGVRIMFNVRMHGSLEYRHANMQRAKARLRKIASDKELDDFRQYLEHEYDQIHEQTCEKNQPEFSMIN